MPPVAAVLVGMAVAVAVGAGPSVLLLLVGLVALAVVSACIQRPAIGLVLLIALTSTYAFDVGEKDLGMQSLRLPFVVMLLVTCVFSNRADRPPLTAIPQALLVVGGFGAFVLLSVFWAVDSEPVLVGTVSLLKILLMVLAVIALTSDARSLRIAVWSLILAGSVLAVISVVQHLTGTFDQTYLGFAKAPVRNIVGETEAPRISGPIGDPNSFAQMMVVLVPLALERCVHERRRRTRVVAGVAALLCGGTTVLTFSRGGLLSLGVVVALFMVRHPPRLRHVVISGAVLLLVLPAVPAAYIERVTSIRQSATGGNSLSADGAIQGRTTQMKIAGAMFRDHAVLGVGQGNYVVRFPEYNRRYGLPPQLGQAPHNLYLEVVAELGLVGMALWLLILVSAFRGLSALKRRPVEPGEEATHGLAEGLRLAWVALLVNSVFLHGSYPMAFWLLVAISLAAAQVAQDPRRADEKQESDEEFVPPRRG